MPENKRKRRRSSSTGYYIDGNTVRKYETIPKELPENQRRKKRRKKTSHSDRNVKNAAARKNREKASKLDLTYTDFLVISVVVTVAVCVGYLSLQNEITRTNVQIATLKSQLSTITNENAAMEERINSAIDLSQVYQTAVNEYGMTAIKEDQIHYYSNENEDYVKQYEQIPTDE